MCVLNNTLSLEVPLSTSLCGILHTSHVKSYIIINCRSIMVQF